jgi:hypothetical protein
MIYQTPASATYVSTVSQKHHQSSGQPMVERHTLIQTA